MNFTLQIEMYYFIFIIHFFNCILIFQEFLLCNEEEKDPRKCLKEGKDVTACGFEFFRKVKNSCLEEINQYANCIEQTSVRYEHHK